MHSSNQALSELSKERLEYVKKLIDTAKQAMTEIVGKNIILITGAAGSGTDILASRLEGKKLLLKKDELSDQYRAIDEDHPQGRNISRPRLLKSALPLQNKLFFCECPEFSSNQTISENAIAKSIILESTINNAQQIRGMIVTIDYNQFTSNTLESIKYLISTLNQFLPPNSKEMRKSVAFVVIQKPSSKTTAEAHQAILSAIKNELAKTNNTESTWWSLLEQNLVVMDFKDMATSNKTLLDKVRDFSEIKPTEFNFTDYDYSRKTFINAIHDTAVDIERATQLEEKISHTEEGADTLKKLENNINQLTNEITEKINQKLLLREEIRDKRDILDKMKKKENLVKYWFDNLHEERNPIYKLGFAGYSEKKFEYDDIPFDEVKLKQKNGYFTNEMIDKEHGKYSITYKSHFGYSGEASVEIHVKENQLPENKAVIEKLNEEINEKRTQKEKCTDVLAKLTETQDKLQEELLELHKHSPSSLERVELEMKLSRLQNSIDKSQDAFKTAIKYFDDFKIPQPDFSDPLYKLTNPIPEPMPAENVLNMLSMFAKHEQDAPQSTNINIDQAENKMGRNQPAAL